MTVTECISVLLEKPTDHLQFIFIMAVLMLVLFTQAGGWAAEGPVAHLGVPDTLGEAEITSPEGPTFESVSSHFPAMKYPKEAVGVPEGPQEIAVMPDGSLMFGDVKACFTVGGAAERFGMNLGLNKCSKRLADGYLPIVIASNFTGGFPCEETIVGWSPRMSPDTPLFGLLRLQLTNTSSAQQKVKVQFVTDTPVIEWSLVLPAGKSGAVHVKVPFDRPYEAKKITPAVFDKGLAEASDCWKTVLNTGMHINVPEQGVNDAYRAWLAYNFLAVDKQPNGIYEPHDGAAWYEAVFGYSASRYCYALDQWGYHAEAQRYLDSLLTFVSPDGSLMKNYGLPDTGAQLWAMGQHYQMTHDDAWLRKVAPTMLKMCDWVITKRKESRAGQQPGSLGLGLIKDKPYADEPEAAYSYHSDTYLALGLQESANAFREIGMTTDADRVQREADSYRQDILASMDRATIEHGGMKMLPMFPETQALLKRADYTANGYYSLVASMVLETGILPAGDHQARLITDLLERKGGLFLGVCAWSIGIDHAYTYGYWLNCLQRGDVDRAILGFYTSLAYGMSRDTYSGVELTTIRTGENTPALPHLYSGTQQLLLLRNMLVREDGETLILAQATPRKWLAPGEKIEVRNAPTLFGTVSYAIEATKDGKHVTIRLDPPTERMPDTIKIYLRHPQRLAVKSVAINGIGVQGFSDESITLSHCSDQTMVEVSYE